MRRVLFCCSLLGLLSGQPVMAVELQRQVLASGLQYPWALAFLDQGRMLLSERPGRMRLLQPDGQPSAPLDGVPAVDDGGQGGLLDVIADRNYAANHTIYFCYAQPGTPASGNATALASARLNAAAGRLEQVRVLFVQQPRVASRLHFGCRIVDDGDGSLFLTLGERYSRMQDAQSLGNHLGKVVRIGKDGRVPADNPFVGRSGAMAEIWSYGHRNPQGATLGPDGQLWLIEHGPQGGDELNRIQPGRNYGWPVISHGEQYGGGPIGAGITAKAGMEQPVHYWTPSIAPSGMAFLHSSRYGEAWRGSLLVGALKFQYLARLVLDGGRVVGEEKLLTDLRQRIRDVRVGPDGLIYVLTDAANGQLIRLLPR